MTISQLNSGLDSISLSRCSLVPYKSLTAQKITYIALASLGLAVAVGACFAAPPLALALSMMGVLISGKITQVYLSNNPGTFKQTVENVKSIVNKCLGFFSKKHCFTVEKPLHCNQIKESTLRKVALFALTLISTGLLVASFLVATQLGFVFSAVVAGITLYKWLDYALMTAPERCMHHL